MTSSRQGLIARRMEASWAGRSCRIFMRCRELEACSWRRSWYGWVEVPHGRPEARMPQEDLDRSDVHARFEEVRGEGVPKRVRRDVLLDPRVHVGPAKDHPDGGRCNRALRIVAGEQPDLRSVDDPIRPKLLEKPQGQRNVAILVALGLNDPNDHPVAVDVLDSQVRRLGRA